MACQSLDHAFVLERRSFCYLGRFPLRFDVLGSNMSMKFVSKEYCYFNPKPNAKAMLTLGNVGRNTGLRPSHDQSWPLFGKSLETCASGVHNLFAAGGRIRFIFMNYI